MTYSKGLFGQNYDVPEAGDNNVGPAATAILDDLMDAADGGFGRTPGLVIIPRLPSTTTSLAASATLTRTHPVHKVSGSGGPVTLNATTAIANGTVDGELLILQGDHATNTVTIQNNANVRLRGDITLRQYETLELRWDTAIGDWVELRPGVAAFNQSGIELFEAAVNGTNKITLRAPASLAADLTFTLPNTISAGNFLTTDGSGNLSWGSSSSSMQSSYDGGDQITIGAGGSIGVIGPLAQNSQIIVLTQQANQHAMRILKTASGAGSCLDFDDDGTGSTISFVKDGAGSFISGTQNGSAPCISLTVASAANNRAALIEQQGNFNLMRLFKSGTGTGNTLVIEDDGTGVGFLVTKDGLGLAAEFIGTTANDVVKITRSTVGAGIPLTVLSAGSSHEVDIENTAQMTRALLRRAEATGERAAVSFVAGSGLFGDTNGIADVRANVVQADPSALQGSLRFYVNKGDSVYKALELLQDGGVSHFPSLNGAEMKFGSFEVNDTGLSGGTRTYASAIPAGSLVIGWSARVTTTMTGTLTSWDLGITGDAPRFADNKALAAGTTATPADQNSAVLTMPVPAFVLVATNVLLTPNGGTWTAGAIKITIHYIQFIPPTS